MYKTPNLVPAYLWRGTDCFFLYKELPYFLDYSPNCLIRLLRQVQDKYA